MAKGEAKKVNRSINEERNRINQEHGRMSDTLYGRLPGAQQRNTDAYNRVYKGYGDILDDPNYGADTFGDGGYGGNYGDYENMFREFAKTGGLTPENIARIRGSGVFDEFAKTGGYSDADIANLRSQGTATIPAFYNALRNEFERKNRVAGGASPSYGASESRMARDQFREGQAATLNTELGIKNAVNEGRRWGGEHISGAEQGLGELMSRNKLAGMEGGLRATSLGADNAYRRNALASENRLAALSGIRGLRTDVPGEEFGLYDFLQKNAGQRGSLAGHNIDTYAGYNPNVSTWDRIGQIGGSIAGIAGGATGFKNPFKKKKAKTPGYASTYWGSAGGY